MSPFRNLNFTIKRINWISSITSGRRVRNDRNRREVDIHTLQRVGSIPLVCVCMCLCGEDLKFASEFVSNKDKRIFVREFLQSAILAILSELSKSRTHRIFRYISANRVWLTLETQNFHRNDVKKAHAKLFESSPIRRERTHTHNFAFARSLPHIRWLHTDRIHAQGRKYWNRYIFTYGAC